MSENKKFPLSMGDITEILANSGCRVNVARPYMQITRTTIDSPISIPTGEVKVDISGGVSCFLSAMESIFSKCSADHANAVKDQEIAELRQQIAADQNHIEQLRAALDKRASHLTMKIEVDKPRIITALEKCIQEISEAIDDAGIGSDLDKPITPHVTTQDAISEVMAAMHEDELIGNDWIEWHGGECPVRGDLVVEYKLKAGDIDTEPAHRLDWLWRLDSSDIIAYRLAK